MPEKYRPVDPPAIREPAERYRTVEFYVHLGDPRPDVELFARIADWLQDQPPYALLGLDISYHRATTDEPDFVLGVLVISEPIDVG